MAIKIANRQVAVGDRLYHAKLGKWGTVTRFDTSGPAILEIEVPPYGPRKFYIQNGGNINSERAVYWHEPLHLDLPTSDVRFMQSIVNDLAVRLSGKLGGEDSEQA